MQSIQVTMVAIAIAVVFSGCCCSSSTPGDIPKKVETPIAKPTDEKASQDSATEITEDGIEILPQPRVK